MASNLSCYILSGRQKRNSFFVSVFDVFLMLRVHIFTVFSFLFNVVLPFALCACCCCYVFFAPTERRRITPPTSCSHSEHWLWSSLTLGATQLRRVNTNTHNMLRSKYGLASVLTKVDISLATFHFVWFDVGGGTVKSVYVQVYACAHMCSYIRRSACVIESMSERLNVCI